MTQKLICLAPFHVNFNRLSLWTNGFATHSLTWETSPGQPVAPLASPLWPPSPRPSGPCFQPLRACCGPFCGPRCSLTGPRDSTAPGRGLRWAAQERRDPPGGSALTALRGRKRCACGWLRGRGNRRSLGNEDRFRTGALFRRRIEIAENLVFRKAVSSEIEVTA